MKGFEAHDGIRDFLDEIVILLDPIVQIHDLAFFNEADKASRYEKKVDVFQTGKICATFIHDDFMGKAIVG